MASTRRFFVLPEPLLATEMVKLIGHVVTDKMLPMHNFAPFPTSPVKGLEEPRYQPGDILPSLLPSPVTWSNREDFLNQTSDWNVTAGLSGLLGIDSGHTDEKVVSLSSAELKCYALSNTAHTFTDLMKNESYNRDVRQLLKDTGRSQAYFVVGFITAKDSNWTELSSSSKHLGLEVTAPVLEIVGAPVMGVGDPQVAPSIGCSKSFSRRMEAQDERIFAVAYDLVKTRYRLTNARKFIMSSVVNVGPVRGKAGHLVFSDGDSDSEEFVDSDEEETTVVRQPKNRPGPGTLEIDHYSCPTMQDLVETNETAISSFELAID